VIRQAALGLRSHSGWAVVVAVAGPLDSPSVVDRRRIELADKSIPGSVQPYHAAEGSPLAQAEEFIGRCRAASNALARRALDEVLADLLANGFRAVRSCILRSSGRPLGTLAATLASHALIHTAEGEFYRDALRHGLDHHAVPVMGVKERDLLPQAAEALNLSVEQVQRKALELGKSIGPPWRQDEKLATIAAWRALLALEL
jgi:hypothetical protein